MGIKEKIAKNFLNYREKAGYKQSEVAKALGVSKSSVCNWETGQNSMDIEKLYKACQLFEVTLYDMFGESVDQNKTKQVELIDKKVDSDTNEILSLYSKLDNNDKIEIKGEIKGMLKADKYSIKDALSNKKMA